MKRKLFILTLILAAVISAWLLLSDRAISQQATSDLATLKVIYPEVSQPVVLLQDNLPPPDLSAHAFISTWLKPNGQFEVLTEKNANLRWPIASITKLFTASLISQENIVDQTVEIKNVDIMELADRGLFAVGDKILVSDLLTSLLLESSNNAAMALSRLNDNKPQDFISRLNNLSQKIGLQNTALFNPSGLDPVASGGTNYSTAYDLTLLGKWLIENQPKILNLTRLPVATIRRADGSFHHETTSTNELLTNEPWSSDIVGGKTGSTDLAGKNLLLILRAPNDNGYLINAVLGSPDHFSEMRRLVSWVLSAYQF